ncbi:MAG TPA: FHA domain-containing protein [Syntrophomonadaceae bacterium]|nr:FHA domain-containing protein [Syntrophomonadaceae bacterium]
MQLTRCDNGHYYDSSKHSSCPHCGVQNLDIDFQKTMARKPAGVEGGPAGIQAGAAQGGEARTVGVLHKKLGIDPVVGWLVCIEGPERGRDFRIHGEKNFIGRSEKMDIPVVGDESISRENHSIVSYNPKKNIFRIYPGDSRGLVYLNEEEVISPVALNPYDIIELGQTKLLFVPFCGERFSWQQEPASDEDN